MKNILKNKNCLITGATGGIGKHIVKSLVEQDCNVFLTSKNNIKLKNFSESLKTNNSKINYFAADLNNSSQITRLIKKVTTSFSSTDILINCAGIFKMKSIEKCTEKDFNDIFNINMKTPFLLSKEFSKGMKKKKWGRIVNLGSSSSYSGFPNSTLYCSTKHGILGLSRALSSELREYNIRVYCISPSSTRTDMAKVSTGNKGVKFEDQDSSTFLNPKEVAEFILHTISYDSEMIVDETRLNRMVIR